GSGRASAPARRASRPRRRTGRTRRTAGPWQTASVPPGSVALVDADLEAAAQLDVEVEEVPEVGPRVVVRLVEQVGLDEVEDDLAEVVGAVDAPEVEDDAGHAAELAPGQVAGAGGQLGAADVVLGAGVGGAGRLGRHPAEPLLRVRQRLEDELVRLVGVARV